MAVGVEMKKAVVKVVLTVLVKLVVKWYCSDEGYSEVDNNELVV